MSDFNYRSKGLSTKYVYYQWLDEYHPILKRNMQTEFWRIKHQTANVAKVTTKLKSIAASEQSKEKRLLKQYFGLNVDYDLNDISTIKDFIDGINSVMNLSDVYERNKAVIQNINAKNIMSWFPGYFDNAWEKIVQEKSLESELAAALESGLSVEDAAEKVIPMYIEKAVVEALRYMMVEADVEHDSIDPQLKQAYNELVAAIGNLNTPGIASEFYKIYNLDELKHSLVSGFKKSAKNFDSTNAVKNFKTTSKSNIHQKGGIAMEVLAAIKAEFAGNKNIKVTGKQIDRIHTGDYGVKADSIITYGFDTTPIEKALKEMKGTVSYERNIEAFSKLGPQLEKIPDGFVVYVNSKNYSLGGKFKSRGGFSAGTAMTAQQYGELFKNIESNVDTFVGAMMQLGKGAIGESEKEPFEKIIASNVAYLLFDDYTTIGVDQSGGNALHVMDLNGIIMPLSVVLSALAQAIEQGDREDFRQIVDVNIHAPKILYQNIEEELDYVKLKGADNAHVAWEHQREVALDQTKIATHFLKAFQDIVRAYL